MKAIKLGCTEAKTRDGQLVTEIKWFKVNGTYKCEGILNEALYIWEKSGKYYKDETSTSSSIDLYAMPKSKREVQ